MTLAIRYQWEKKVGWLASVGAMRDSRQRQAFYASAALKCGL